MSGSTTAPTTYDFNEVTQTEILSCIMWDSDFCKSTEGLIEPRFFENTVDGILAEIALEHYAQYKETASKTVWTELVKENVASGRIRPDIKTDLIKKWIETFKMEVRSRDWILDKLAEFAKQRNIIEAMMEASKAIFRETDPDRFAKVEKVMAKAFSTSLISLDDDYDYFERIEERTQTRRDIIASGVVRTGITTGVKELDDLLMHKGWGRKELSLLMGGAKSSKSFHLSFFATKATLAGYNVLFVTLENSREITSGRIDAMVSGIGMKDHLNSPNTVDIHVRDVAALPTTGKLKIREFPSGTFKPGDLRRIIDSYKTKGLKFDLIVVDYLDIMAPDHREQSNIENSKSIYLAVRAIAQEENCGMLSATQTNREGHKSAVSKAEHVAEDFNRIRIADVVIAINRTEDERANNKARLTFAACRNQPDGYTIEVTQNLDMGLAIASVESVE